MKGKRVVCSEARGLSVAALPCFLMSSSFLYPPTPAVISPTVQAGMMLDLTKILEPILKEMIIGTGVGSIFWHDFLLKGYQTGR